MFSSILPHRPVVGRILSLFPGRSHTDARGDEKKISSIKTAITIQISPMGWRVTGLGDSFWNAPLWQEDPIKGVEQSVRELILRHGTGLLEEVDTISILLDMPGIRYADGKNRLLANGDHTPTTLRVLGAELLNVSEVTFGRMPMGPLNGQKKQDKILFTFADVMAIRGILALFDKLGLKIRDITPQPLLFLPRALEHSQSVYGGLYLGEGESTVVLVNLALGNFTLRHLPVGIVTLARAMATGNAISLEEAFQALADPDLVMGIHPRQEGTSQTGFLEQSLLPPLQLLLTGLQETLEFLASHLRRDRLRNQ